jgi:hypothetical protein
MLEAGRLLFAAIIGDADLTALLLDAAGTQLAGSYLDADGREAGGEIGAALSGVGEEVTRAMRHLSLGDWHALVIETGDATIAIGPGAEHSLVLVAAAASEPHGLVRRILARSSTRADEWLRKEPGR